MATFSFWYTLLLPVAATSAAAVAAATASAAAADSITLDGRDAIFRTGSGLSYSGL